MAEGDTKTGAAAHALGPDSEGALGARVRSARERFGWTREALAFHSGVSWSAIAQIEAGRRSQLRPSTLSAIAGALRLTFDFLASGRPASPTMLEHRVLLYGSEREFADAVVPFLRQAAERGEAAMAVVKPEHIELLRGELCALAGSVRFVERSEWYKTPAHALLGYRQFIDTAVTAGESWTHVVGELLWAGTSKAQLRLWGRYESLLNLALATSPATILCPYDTRALKPEIIEMSCATHPHLHSCEGVVSANPSYASPPGFVLES